MISANPASTYSAARSQGRLEATRAVAAARNLGIVRGSTLFYDLEAFNTRQSSACTYSALYFLHLWTTTLHANGYASGYYSSAASGIRMLDDQRVRTGNRIAMPDQVWIADWNGHANTSSSYIRSDGWQPYGRAKQYQGGHNETWGGVRINIDRNYLNLRTPRLPGSSHAGAGAGPDTGTGAVVRPALHGQLARGRQVQPDVDQPRGLPTDERRARHLRHPAAVPAQAAAPLPLRGHREVELADHHRTARLPGAGRARPTRHRDPQRLGQPDRRGQRRLRGPARVEGAPT